MQRLELQKPHLDLIRRVCDLEHDSLIRCHTKHSQDSLDELSDQLNASYITLKEFHSELSNAFYEFQVVWEEPHKLTSMEYHYLQLFSGIMDIYEEILIQEFPGVFEEIQTRLTLILELSQDDNNLAKLN
jgi:hypothetical protein